MAVSSSLWRRARDLDPLIKDGLLALGLLLVSSWGLLIPGLLSAVIPAVPSPPPSPGLVPLAALMIAPVVMRQRWPLTGYGLQVGAWTLAALLSGRLGITVSSAAALLVVAYSAGRYSDRRGVSLTVVIVGSLLLTVGPDVVSPDRFGRLRPGDPALLFTVLLPVTSWLAGNSMRSRDRHAVDLRRAAVAEERARIAREMHDVVGHGVSVMIVQAEAGRRLLTRDPTAAAEALRTISAAGAAALGELEHMLSVLDPGDGCADLEPASGLATLEALLSRMRAAGMSVELRKGGALRELPRGLDATAYRIVQEALTNVLKHSGGASAVVRLDYLPDHLCIEVVDSGRGATPAPGGGGRGLLGMHERVAAYGGDLEAGPRLGGGYAVRARLPLRAPR